MVPFKKESEKSEDAVLEELRNLLLRDERMLIHKHEDIFESEEALSARVKPIIEAHLELLKRHFPEHYAKQVDQMISHRLTNSQDELLNTIYPALGMMIKKYVQHQIQLLRESVEDQISSTKKSLFFWQRLGKSSQNTADMLISNAQETRIRELYLIKYPEGIVIGHCADEESLAPDAVAGMLSALKAFMDDAFQKQQQTVHLVQYDTYKLLVEQYHGYYFAALISGPITLKKQDELADRLSRFMQSEYLNIIRSQSDIARKLLSEKLHETFF